MKHTLLAALSAASAITLLTALGCNQILDLRDVQVGPQGGGGSSAIGGAGGEGVGSQGGGGAAPLPPCHPDSPVCNLTDSNCLALTDNSIKADFALRVAQVTVWKPDAFVGGLENGAITQAVRLNLLDCFLNGSGSLSWILSFNEMSGLATLGAAKPVADPTQGYTLVNETIDSGGTLFDIQPVSVPASIATDGTIAADPVDNVVMPIYIGTAGSEFILLPLHQVRVFDAKISTDRNCIGQHNAQGLKPEDGCLPNASEGIQSFIDGAKLDGYMLLEEADNVIISAFNLNRSLCVVLSQDPSKFGNGASPMRCQRINGEIKYVGDWCSTTNSPGDAACHDAAYFGMGFAASAVDINP